MHVTWGGFTKYQISCAAIVVKSEYIIHQDSPGNNDVLMMGKCCRLPYTIMVALVRQRLLVHLV